MKTQSISGTLIAAIMSASMMLVGCAGDDIGGGPAEKANAIQEAEQPVFCKPLLEKGGCGQNLGPD